MKIYKIARFVLGAGITLALAAVITLPLSSSAADHLKGGQLQIGERTAQVQALPPLDLTTISPACSSCTNVIKPFATSAGRGAFVKTGVTVTHLCPSCKTATVTSDTGKARVAATVHTCGNGLTPACCSGMAAM